MVAIVTLNSNNKIELTKEELETLLEEAIQQGKNEAYALMNQPITITEPKVWYSTNTPVTEPKVLYSTKTPNTTLV